MDMRLVRYMKKHGGIYETLYIDGEPVMGSPEGLDAWDIILWHKHNCPDNDIKYSIAVEINEETVEIL